MWDTSDALPLLVQDGATKYLSGPNGLPLEQIDGAGRVLYDLHDQLGSTRLLLDSAGATQATYTYDAYGNLTAQTRTGTGSGAAATPFGFAGQYTDAETGLQYLQARYYDPRTGQFTSVDPLVEQTGQPYAYTSDDPLNATDPTGLCSYLPCQDYGSGPDTAGTPSLADASPTLLEDSALAALLHYAQDEPCLDGTGTPGGLSTRITAAGALPFGGLGALGALGAASAPEDIGLGAGAVAAAPLVATGAAVVTLGGIIYTQEILGPDSLYPPTPLAPTPLPVAPLPGYASSPMPGQITATYPDPSTQTVGLAPTILPSVEGSPEAVDGEASLGQAAERGRISKGAAQRIQNAATRTKQRITVVGSRAAGTAGPDSDWDYILSGKSSARHSARSSLPRGTSGGELGSGGYTGIDTWQDYNPKAPNYGTIDPARPYIIFEP